MPTNDILRCSKLFTMVIKKLARMFDGFSRSKALDQLVMYYDYGLLDDEEISQLSSETRERVLAILKLWKEL